MDDDTPAYLAGDITTWIDDKATWVETTAPWLFLIVVSVIAIILMIRTQGMIRKLIVFLLGAAVVYMILVNIPAIADMFGTEIINDDGAGSMAPPAVVLDDDGGPR